MILGEVKGKLLHSFCIRGRMVFVVKSNRAGIAAAYRKSVDAISVLAPTGMSYHQAALEAVAAMEAGRFRYKEEA